MKLKKKQPCQTPGCNWPNFHVCLVGKPDTFPELLGMKPLRMRSMGERTQEHKDAMAESMRRVWAEKNYHRDKRIIDLYLDGGVGYKTVAKHIGVDATTALRVLKRAEEKGLITMRKRGHTIAKGAE